MSISVLHVVDSLSMEAGSIAVSLRGLLAALQQRGIQSEVLVDQSDSTGAGDAMACRVHDASSASITDSVADCDLVHLHGWGTSATARAVAKTARARQKACVLSPLGSLCPDPHTQPGFLDRLRRRFLDKRLVESAAAITAINDLEANYLAKECGLAQVMVLPYGLAFEAYESVKGLAKDSAQARRDRCLLLMAPVDPVAGHALLLKCFAEIGRAADGWRVVMAGPERGSWRKSLDAAVRRKGGVDRVSFQPATGESAQRAFLAEASLLVAPGMRIDACVSVLQAIAAGVPVLASDRVAPPALNGCLAVFSANRDGMKQALRTHLTLGDSELKSRAVTALATARKTYDWPILVDRFCSLYDGLR